MRTIYWSLVIFVLGLSGVGHASLSRVAVLGGQPVFQPGASQDGVTSLNSLYVPGSLWYDDDYNIFLNPALINNHRDFASVSYGSSLLPQGGAFASYEYFVFGVYFNRTNQPQLQQPGATFEPFRNVNGYSAAFGPWRPVEVFLGADFGIKYGIHLAYAGKGENDSSNIERDARYWKLDWGVDLLGLQFFFGTNLVGHYEKTEIPQVKQNFDQFNAGLRYQWEEYQPYFIWNQQRENVQAGNSQSAVGSTMTSFGLGLGHDWNPIEGVHFMQNLGFWRASLMDTTDVSSNGYSKSDWTRYVIPLNVALEAEITTCFTLRAGLTFDVLNLVSKELGTASQHESSSFHQHGIVRPRLGAEFEYEGFQLEGGFGLAANTQAENFEAYQPKGANFGLAKDLFAVFTGSYKW